MSANERSNSISRVQAMLLEGGEDEMTELTREELDEIRREVCTKLAAEKSDDLKLGRQ